MGAAKYIADILNALGTQGTLAVGVFIGFLITIVANYMAGVERRHRLKLDLERFEMLHKQLELKDERISALHDDIRRLSAGQSPVVERR
jgi:hypothetical protein